MTTTSQNRRPDRGRGARRVGRWSLLWLLLAVVISLVVYLPFAHWVLEWRMMEYLVAWLLRPSTGFLSMTLALWWLFSVPGTLHLLAGGGRSAAQAAAPADGGAEESAEPTTETDDRIAIPAVPLQELGTGHRFQMAQALGIPWRDELIHDHRSWTRACSEAAHARAAEGMR